MGSAPRTSSAECCFKNRVLTQIIGHKNKNSSRILGNRCFMARLLRATSKMAMLLATWIEGQTLVGWSVWRIATTRRAAQLFSDTGRRSVKPFGSKK